MLEAVPNPEVQKLLSQNAPVAVGVSGGKDSVACALAVIRFLNEIGHTGPRLLIHADLGSVEWQDSKPSCDRLAAHLNMELQTVARAAGGMMERWESRWASSKRRYLALECVKVILPWSTPSMRFCTSELKTSVICSALKKRWGKQPIISAIGIRAEESPNRAKMPIAKENKKLPKGSLDWNPILHWKKEEVFQEIAAAGLPLHEAYTKFGSTRVSCVLCILGSANDFQAALKDERNHPIYHNMCELEAESAFAFQSGKWLMDLDNRHATASQKAKKKADLRQTIEKEIPKHLEFTKGWPETMPTAEEAQKLAGIRKEICLLYGWEPTFSTPDEISSRYRELFSAKLRKEGNAAKTQPEGRQITSPQENQTNFMEILSF